MGKDFGSFMEISREPSSNRQDHLSFINYVVWFFSSSTLLSPWRPLLVEHFCIDSALFFAPRRRTFFDRTVDRFCGLSQLRDLEEKL